MTHFQIANLIRPHIFENLIDDDSVKDFPSVKGMASNLFFIDHSHLENEVKIQIGFFYFCYSLKVFAQFAAGR
jgi:hypothetical protein